MLARALLTALVCAVAAGPAAAARTIDLGDSVQGREIIAVEVAGAHPRSAVLVVGCIHGNEPAGIAIAHALTRTRPPSGVALWILPDLNPDGVAAGTRQNAHGVDLNRNFPTRWQAQSGTFASGPHPLSELETRIAYRLILRVRPAVSIWFHQHENLVDDSSGNRPLEQRFAESVELPVRPLARYGGSAVTWEAARFPGTSPFVVELPAGSLSPATVRSFVHAVLAVESHLGSPRRFVASKLDE
jgi:murein peptide amidase A